MFLLYCSIEYTLVDQAIQNPLASFFGRINVDLRLFDPSICYVQQRALHSDGIPFQRVRHEQICVLVMAFLSGIHGLFALATG